VLQTASQVITNPAALVRSLLVEDDTPLEERQTLDSSIAYIRKEEEDVEEETTDEQMKTVLSQNNFTLSQLEENGWVLPSDTPISLWLKSFEGYVSKAEWDVSQNTNGFGTEADHADETITVEEAQKRLLARIESDEKLVEKFGKENGYVWTDNEKMALVSFIYNGGYAFLKEVSGLWEWERDEEGKKIPNSKLIPSGKPKRYKEEIAEYMVLYYNTGGKASTGLKKRRLLERDLFKGILEI